MAGEGYVLEEEVEDVDVGDVLGEDVEETFDVEGLLVGGRG